MSDKEDEVEQPKELIENIKENHNTDSKNTDIDETNRSSDVQLGRVSDATLEKINNVKPNQDEEDSHKKVGSIHTIFSIWNTMIGSSIVSIPYNVYNAGIIPTVVLGLSFGFICFFTCSLYIKLSDNEKDFANVVSKYFKYAFGVKAAKVGKVTQIIFNLMINIGATFIYFLIINQNLYPCICLILNKLFDYNFDDQDLQPHFDKFSLIYCSFIVSVIEFPLTILKSLHPLVKFNSYGIYFVSSLLIYVIYVGIASFFNTSFHFKYEKNIIDSVDRNLYLFGVNPGLIAGTLSLGLFSHSVIIPIMKHNRNQKKNQRDLFCGYLCVTLTYIIIGILGYIGFSGSKYGVEFLDNWFRFEKGDNIIMIILRALNVIQLSSIFPILFFVVRSQLFSTLFKNDSPSMTCIIIFSLFLLGLCTLVLYTCYDILGKLIGIIGASTALVLVYTIPVIVNIIHYRMRHREEDTPRITGSNENDEQSSLEESMRTEKKKALLSQLYNNQEPPKKINKCKVFFFYVFMIMIILIGIFTLAVQFYPINFFGIVIKDSNKYK